MKRFFTILAVTGSLSLGMIQSASAQDVDAVVAFEPLESYGQAAEDTTEVVRQESVCGTLRSGFTEENSGLVAGVLVAFALGLVVCVARMVSLHRSDADTKKLLEKIESAVEKGDVEGAADVCRSTRGAVASVCCVGLQKIDEDMDIMERAMALCADVQKDNLYKIRLWIRVFVVLTLALGVLSAFIGMAMAFGNMSRADGIAVASVAGDVQAALFPLIAGLAASLVLYVLYACVCGKIASIIRRMKIASGKLLDIAMAYNWKYKR